MWVDACNVLLKNAISAYEASSLPRSDLVDGSSMATIWKVCLLREEQVSPYPTNFRLIWTYKLRDVMHVGDLSPYLLRRVFKGMKLSVGFPLFLNSWWSLTSEV